ncbi:MULTISPECIES: hypothetical protein [unclassified Streptomyces]|uniref:hypothetical protein n=1 Tax=unclassified Streptomyces TaxID=2593676 RepID=UPI001EFE6FE4|nr:MULTISPECIES: hypothetical protein [unclassified Streptomyces]
MSRTAFLELVGLPDSDDEELSSLSIQLRRSLTELDVADVRSASATGTSRPGAKSGELVATGTIVITAASFVLRQALLLADTWLKNRPVRSIRVELDGRSIELGHASASEREKLIDVFLQQEQSTDGDGSTAEPSQEPNPV